MSSDNVRVFLNCRFPFSVAVDVVIGELGDSVPAVVAWRKVLVEPALAVILSAAVVRKSGGSPCRCLFHAECRHRAACWLLLPLFYALNSCPASFLTRLESRTNFSQLCGCLNSKFQKRRTLTASAKASDRGVSSERGSRAPSGYS